jgi:predicted N-acetyltransferase YhbS
VGRLSEPAIRAATDADAAAIVRLIGELGYSVTEDEVRQRLPLIAGPGLHALVAELDGAVVGCLTTSAMQVLHRRAPVGRIAMMVVADGLRGRGIGRFLVRAAEALLVADDCYMVEVTSNLARPDAHRFYEGLGYERTSLRFAREPSA